MGPVTPLRAVLAATSFATDEGGALWHNDGAVGAGKWWTRWTARMALPGPGSVHESQALLS